MFKKGDLVKLRSILTYSIGIVLADTCVAGLVKVRWLCLPIVEGKPVGHYEIETYNHRFLAKINE